jgi:hypothetical protein
MWRCERMPHQSPIEKASSKLLKAFQQATTELEPLKSKSAFRWTRCGTSNADPFLTWSYLKLCYSLCCYYSFRILLAD